MNSSKKINYSTRVAKNIERKMLRDLLIRFSAGFPTNDYTYVGFGSKYFTDFLMVHKYLHIDKLISIEGDIGNKPKYDFNKPLNCIDMKYGMSTNILPEIELDKNRSIVWLDYDGLLEEYCLGDIVTLSGELESGSVLFVSYNSRPPKPAELEIEFPEIGTQIGRLNAYIKKVHGESYIPHDLELRGLSKWENYSSLLRMLIVNCIEKRLEVKNRGLAEKVKLKQLVNFNYQDGCEMSTVGFTFYTTLEEAEKLEQSNLKSFDFYRDNEVPYIIEVPNLTLKEVKALLEIMPKGRKGRKKELEKIIPPSDIEQFSKIYKYLPIFTDSELA
ncbi:O-methyltransferase [Algibacillus agarilyticus]|uniref:O-methyltransferase n=1 Tax=Algibacillus agarilyticus TaxID=2234133 RepID=UPI000DD02E2E|nr:O-methyltransferase [Algibacillus agarilyticus]